MYEEYEVVYHRNPHLLFTSIYPMDCYQNILLFIEMSRSSAFAHSCDGIKDSPIIIG